MLEKPAQCRDCPAYSVGIGYVPSRGPQSGPLAIIGQGPGEDEVRAGKPFVGKSGGMLSSWVRKSGLREPLLHIDNVVRCRLVVTNKAGDPILNPSGGLTNRAPTAAEARYCWAAYGRPSLVAFLEGHPHPTVAACGVPAMAILLGQRGKAGFAGNVFEVEL